MRAALLALFLLAAPAAAAPPSIDASRTNVLWVTICTLRADHLGTGGYPQPTSPRLDALADRGVVFERVLTSAPWTRPAMAAMVTGIHPRALGIAGPRDSLRLALPEAFDTLAERLRAAGYRTLAISGNPNVNETFGFGQGFDFFRSFDAVPFAKLRSGQKLAAEEGVALLLERLRGLERGQRFFAHLVLVDVHYPYRADVARRRLPGIAFPAGATREYDLQIRYVDDVLGELFDTLVAMGLEDTLIVVNSDHGEAFGVKPEDRWHGAEVYNTTIWVPWILHHPALSPRRISQLVEGVDPMATVLDLLGLPLGSGLDGRSQAAAVRGVGEPAARDLSVVETEMIGARKAAALADGWKLIVDGLDTPTHRLYRWAEDPLELRDLAGEEPARAARLAAQLAEWRSERDARAPAGPVLVELTEGQREALRALGYAEE